MKKFWNFKRFSIGLCLLCLVSFIFNGCSNNIFPNNKSSQEVESRALKDVQVDEDGTYTSKEEVAAYIHKYNRLPSNFITEEDAAALGWTPSQANLDIVAPGKSIGGNPMEFIEEKIEQKEGRIYYKCDIDYKRGYRGKKRIVYSNDGMIYYTPDHYKTYELLQEARD